MTSYAEFLERKRMVDPATGLAQVPDLHPDMFDFQRDITAWALRRGRAALFAGTGLGKSLMELVWADAVHNGIGKRSTTHLNLTRSLADVWRTSERASHAAKIQCIKRRAKFVADRQNAKPPYAGYDPKENDL